MLECKQVSHHFASEDGEILIANELSTLFQKNTTYALTGPSGCGKSTLLNILAGLLKPAKGSIFAQEQSIYDWGEEGICQWRRTETGYIYQDFRLLEKLTAQENIALSLQLMGTPQKEALIKAAEMLQHLGLEKRLKHYPHQLSGGEQQRIALGRAFISPKKMIFADEPTGNLDKNSSKKVMQLMLSFAKENQCTLILVTHDDTIASSLDHHYRLEDGSLIQLASETSIHKNDIESHH